MTLDAKNYQTREDLEADLFKKIGKDISANSVSDHKISGTRAELAVLSLNDTSTVYGVKCEITDEPTNHEVEKDRDGNPKRNSVPDRGPRTRSGINLQN